MTEIALQKELITKISKIKDKKELEFLNNYIFTAKDKVDEPELTTEMSKLIAISENQLQEGQFKTHNEAMKEIDLWMKDMK
jgi:hypothetical protein